jgi:hypothetical protein
MEEEGNELIDRGPSLVIGGMTVTEISIDMYANY